MRIRIEKLSEVDNPLHPNNIKEGFVREGGFIALPEVGHFFTLHNQGTSYFVTTRVIEVLEEESIFKTHNSVYKFELFE